MSAGPQQQQQQQVFACACLNVRVHVDQTAAARTALEDNADVLECTLGPLGIQTALGALVEVKTGSSIDPNISVVRCLLCSTAVAYFKPAVPLPVSMVPHDQLRPRQLPAPQTTVYLARDTKCGAEIAEIELRGDYSEPFGVLLGPEAAAAAAVDPAKRRLVHVPRELQQRASEYMRQKEAEKSERVRAFIREQDDELEALRQRTMDQSAAVAALIGKRHGSDAAAIAQSQPTKPLSGAQSGLAAMLKGAPKPATASIPNPFARSTGSHTTTTTTTSDYDPLEHGFGNDDAQRPSRHHRHHLHTTTDYHHRSPRQLDDDLDDLDDDDDDDNISESDDDNDDDNENDGSGAMGMPRQQQQQQQQQRWGAGGVPVVGSMPIQIPQYGSGSIADDTYLNRRELRRRADEREMYRRQERAIRNMSKTFVPPHKLMDSIYELDSDMVIGSKPRDAYPMPFRHGP
ncbi:hypothetical protein H4R18_002629 [Coemansia javaensis]|uniref:Uncharacterized protein n=1 Tax=Coemansia javaensis TaxID=2761396 RepID=A0A9W8HB78_9FUNG|nr:hypothetical protein H4R18_002629 [Coemansia javaensis]